MPGVGGAGSTSSGGCKVGPWVGGERCLRQGISAGGSAPRRHSATSGDTFLVTTKDGIIGSAGARMLPNAQAIPPTTERSKVNSIQAEKRLVEDFSGPCTTRRLAMISVSFSQRTVRCDVQPSSRKRRKRSLVT